MKRQSILAMAIIAILVIILRIPSLEEPFDNDSSAAAYSARLIIRGEPLYSTHHPGHHLPGVYYSYALAFKLFGDRFQSVKLLLIPWVIATAYLVYGLGFYIHNHRTGFLAAIIFSVLSSHLYLKGTTGEKEMFAILPFTAATFLAVRLIQRKAPGWQFILMGFLGGLAFFYKAVFLAPLAIATGMILLDFWTERREAKSIPLAFQRLLGLASGFGSVFLIAIAYFSSQGLLDRFLMVFSSGKSYVDLTNQYPAINILVIPIYILAVNNLFVLIFGFAGALRMLREIHWESHKNQVFNIPALGIVLWFILSLLTAGITRVDYPHYALIVIPSLSVLAGWELNQLYSLFSSYQSRRKRRVFQAIFGVLLLLTFTNSALTNWQQYSHYIRYRLGKESYSTYLEKGTLEGHTYIRNRLLTEYIVARTTPEEKIYYWTDFPQIYYLSDRRSAIDTIWPTQMDLTGSHLLIFSPQTRYIILGSSVYLPEPPWFATGLAKAYHLEATIEGQRIYRRNDE